jgi:tetratricopeptide (TPR) repeat protein
VGGSRVSFIWLLVMELAALALGAVLYLVGVVPEGYFFFVLALAVIIAGLAFLALFLVANREPNPGRPRAKFEIARADEIDAKVEEYMNLGRQLLREERYDEAAKMFQEVLARNARSWQAHNYLGRAMACQGMFEDAKKSYERAISLEFNYASGHFNLATAHEKLGELEEAMDRWRQYIEVGQTIGERDDMLDHARQRIDALAGEVKRNGRRNADDWGESEHDF